MNPEIREYLNVIIVGVVGIVLGTIANLIKSWQAHAQSLSNEVKVDDNTAKTEATGAVVDKVHELLSSERFALVATGKSKRKPNAKAKTSAPLRAKSRAKRTTQDA